MNILLTGFVFKVFNIIEGGKGAMGSSSFYLPDIATRATGHYIIQFVPSLIIHTVSGQVAENFALFEAHIEGCITVDADIA